MSPLRNENPGISKLKELSRRDFINALGLMISAAFTGNLIRPFRKIAGPMYNLESENSQEKEDIIEINIMLTFIKKVYGVDVYNGETHINRYFLNNIEKLDVEDILPENYDLHKKMSIHEIRKELQILLDELIKYPPNMFGKGKVSFVRLIPEFNSIQDLLDTDSKYAGSVMYLSRGKGHSQTTTTAEGMRNLSSSERKKVWGDIFTHEMFHSFCLANMSIYSRYFNFRVPDLEGYFKINDKDVNDLSVIREDYNPNFFEDIANLAALLMSSKSHKKFLLRIKTEDEEAQKLLQGKYDAIKAIYYDFSDGLMDEQYWDDLLNDKINVVKDNGILRATYWIDKNKKQILDLNLELDN